MIGGTKVPAPPLVRRFRWDAETNLAMIVGTGVFAVFYGSLDLDLALSMAMAIATAAGFFIPWSPRRRLRAAPPRRRLGRLSAWRHRS
ncbi:MAG: hypothetical protein HYR63_16440 [Proteobacteria bacterium]|nr:hypothetical protein [Pseudomonadota bacterium]MBI3498945.1 hypothetical protein [Pseudomonadota bacterium]